jgi:hypothetical protein
VEGAVKVARTVKRTAAKTRSNRFHSALDAAMIITQYILRRLTGNGSRESYTLFARLLLLGTNTYVV